MQGIIFKGIGGFYYIKAENGVVYECKARGIFRKEKIKPMIGDRVEIEIIDEKHGNISKIMPRTSELIRQVQTQDLLRDKTLHPSQKRLFRVARFPAPIHRKAR